MYVCIPVGYFHSNLDATIRILSWTRGCKEIRFAPVCIHTHIHTYRTIDRHTLSEYVTEYCDQEIEPRQPTGNQQVRFKTLGRPANFRIADMGFRKHHIRISVLPAKIHGPKQKKTKLTFERIPLVSTG